MRRHTDHAQVDRKGPFGYNASAETNGNGACCFYATIHNCILDLWAKRPRQADSRPAIRLSNGGKFVEGVLRSGKVIQC